MDRDYDAIVVGGGAAGAICAATLAVRGAHVLLVAETAKLGHNVRSLELDGHRAIIQHPLWHFAWGGGGNWAKVMREQNLAARLHVPGHPRFVRRGETEMVELPVLLSAKATCDAVLQLVPVEVDDAARSDLERVIYAGLAIPPDELFSLHDVSIGSWLDQQRAGELTRQIIITLGANFAGLPAELVADAFSVFGVFVHIRVFISGEGLPVFIEPDIQWGLIEPLAARVEEMGGDVWRAVHVEDVLIESGTAVGIRMKDGREARASHVAIAVGNSRIPKIMSAVPPELEPVLAKEAALTQGDLCTVRLLSSPVVDITNYTVVLDPATGATLWTVPLHEMAPWNSPDDRQLCLVWVSGGRNPDGSVMDNEQAEKYIDDMCEERWPGWVDAIAERASISHTHHWMNPCYTGPKITRRVPSVDRLWFVGEGTQPVAGIALEQAGFAGYEGALAIAAELGLKDVLLDKVFVESPA